MKKLMALALAVVMVLSLGVTAIAEEKPNLKFETEPFTQEGQTKDVKLVAENVGEVTMLQLAIAYDAEKLELVNLVVEEPFADGDINDAITGEIYIVWDSNKAASIDGVIATMTFKAISDELGEAKLGFVEGEDFIISDSGYPQR